MPDSRTILEVIGRVSSIAPGLGIGKAKEQAVSVHGTGTADRSELTPVREHPFNAETPTAGLTGDITPTDLHYVRGSHSLPPHDGTLRIDGTVSLAAD